jgi:hypothetical protein
MKDTLVIQSHCRPLPFEWLETCIESVAGWARQNAFDYRFLGDEIFDALRSDLRDKILSCPPMASDIVRLHALHHGLEEGYCRVVWLDADFLVFAADDFGLPEDDFAVGRQVWVQPGERGRPRVYRGVHNAFLMFARGNALLEFYLATAERLLRLNRGSVPPQFVGPKLLTALHNIARFPVMESAAMLSPMVIRDLLQGGGDALELWRAESPAPAAGANLCSSLTAREGFGTSDMTRLIRLLQDQ